MANNFLGRPPKSWIIPATKGCDRAFTVRRKDSAGEPVDWDAEVYIVIDIDKDEPTTVQADVSGSIASFLIDSETCDSVKNATRWRIIMSDDNGLETPLAVGRFERYDG